MAASNVRLVLCRGIVIVDRVGDGNQQARIGCFFS
jgi:hypothetical protein